MPSSFLRINECWLQFLQVESLLQLVFKGYDLSLIYSEVSNRRGVFLILFEKHFPTACPILISEKPATNTAFM